MSSNKYIQIDRQNRVQLNTEKRETKYINFGIVVYLLLFTYLVFIIISFALSDKTNFSIAEPGAITTSDTFIGVIIKDETVIVGSASGQPKLFVMEGEKVKEKAYICYVNDEYISDFRFTNEGQTVRDTAYFIDEMTDYVIEKNNKDFHYTYDAYEHMKQVAFDINNLVILDEERINRAISDQSLTVDGNLYRAPSSVIVSYHFDGYEGLTPTSIDYPSLYTGLNQQPQTVNTYSVGAPLFKIVSNYKWYLAAEINDTFEKYLEDKEDVSLYFERLDRMITANKLTITNTSEKTYVLFEFDKYLEYFLNNRYETFVIIYDSSEGIKIPNTAVAEKRFIKVPSEAVSVEGAVPSVLKKVQDQDKVGEESVVRINLDVYYQKDGYAYIPMTEELGLKDKIIYNLDQEYVLRETENREGVYVINKGYAAFRFIETITSDNDYRIVKDNTSYGISPYDRISVDAQFIEENELIN